MNVRVDGAGRRALSLYAGGAVEVWDLRNRRSELVLYPHDEHVTEVFLTADGETLVTSSWDRTVKVWDLTRNELVHTFKEHDGQVEHFAVHNRTVLSVSDDDAQAILWEVDSGRVTGRFTADGPLRSCAISPDGRTFALGELSGRLSPSSPVGLARISEERSPQVIRDHRVDVLYLYTCRWTTSFRWRKSRKLAWYRLNREASRRCTCRNCRQSSSTSCTASSSTGNE